MPVTKKLIGVDEPQTALLVNAVGPCIRVRTNAAIGTAKKSETKPKSVQLVTPTFKLEPATNALWFQVASMQRHRRTLEETPWTTTNTKA